MWVKPQKEHHWLQKLVGEWTYETEVMMRPDQPSEKATGTETVRSLGGLWILAEGRGEMCGADATTIMTLEYDPQKQRYVGTWIGSMMSYLWKRPTVQAGGYLRTAVGVLAIDSVDIVHQKLVQFDAKSSEGPWTMTVLHLISEHPEVRAAELAALAHLETPIFKTKVRKLKELGLTESIARGGYRLSPQGQEVLDRLDST